jgi:hypothetical protein
MIAWSQADSIDYFPLSVGNSWTYQYQSNDIDYNTGCWSDSGIAQYSILSNNHTIDSTIWTFREIKDIIRKFTPYFPVGPDTSYLVKDTSIFQLIEYHSGNHRIVRVGYWYSDWKSAFPFYPDAEDTVQFYRYYEYSSDTIYINQSSLWTVHAAFKRNIGVIKMDYSYSISGYYQESNFILQNSMISDVEMDRTSPMPNTFILEQNYPNPFNPITTISFRLLKQSSVKVRIYNILGKLISSIYDGIASSGNHIIQWNASDQSSGIYFCRFDVAGMSKSIKIVLLK